MFGPDISSLVDIENKKKDTFFIVKDRKDNSDDTTLIAEKEYFINMTVWLKKKLPKFAL